MFVNLFKEVDRRVRGNYGLLIEYWIGFCPFPSFPWCSSVNTKVLSLVFSFFPSSSFSLLLLSLFFFLLSSSSPVTLLLLLLFDVGQKKRKEEGREIRREQRKKETYLTWRREKWKRGETLSRPKRSRRRSQSQAHSHVFYSLFINFTEFYS